MRIRVNEHKRSVNNIDATSALAEHTSNTGHVIDFDNVRILDSEKKSRHFFAEMLHIYRTKNDIYRQTDTIKLKN